MPPTLLGAGFTAMKTAGSLLGSLFGSGGGENMTRYEDAYTKKAANRLDKLDNDNYSALQQNIGTSLRNRQREATDLATKSLGNQVGLPGNNMTAGALKSMAGAHGMNTLQDTVGKAYDTYGQQSQQIADSTAKLADSVNLRFNPNEGNFADNFGKTLMDLPQNALDSETQAGLIEQSLEGKNDRKSNPRGFVNMLGGLFGFNGF